MLLCRQTLGLKYNQYYWLCLWRLTLYENSVSSVSRLSKFNEKRLISNFSLTVWKVWTQESFQKSVKHDRVIVVPNRTVVDVLTTCAVGCGSHLQGQSELYHVSKWYQTRVIDLIGQYSRDVIGRLSDKPWCYWLWRLWNVHGVFRSIFFVTVEQWFIVSLTFGCFWWEVGNVGCFAIEKE